MFLSHDDWTRERIRAVQRALGVSPDGVVGEDTAFAALGLIETLDAPRRAPQFVSDLPWDQDAWVHGFDTSGHQRSEDLDLEAAARTQRFHVVKVSEGGTYRFPGARARVEASREAGMQVGEYHFLRPEVLGWRDDFDNWLKNSLYEAGDLPPMIDAEKGRRRSLGNGRFAPASRVMAEANFADLILMGDSIGQRIGAKPLVYFTRPSWQWYFRRAGDGLKARLGEIYDVVLADYVRTANGEISGDAALLPEFEHDDLTAMRASGLTGRVVGWQWTGRGSVSWYANGRKPIDRMILHRSYFEEV